MSSLVTTSGISEQQTTRAEWPSVTDFYAGRDIFVTGGTGFMGKCLLEKILRSVPGEGKIYFLLRPKKGKTVQERLKDLKSNKVFSNLTKTSPDTLQRLVPIEGDISLPGLGISEEDTDTISNNVSVIFHVAATIRFDEHLRKSLQLNVLGVREIVQLARKTKQLKCLVHVSTAYCNCQMEEINEVIYQNASSVNYKDVLSSLMWMTDEQFDVITPTLLKDRPNTYTFTKAMAENLLQEEASDLPVAIIRPSIIGAAVKEPFAGWVDCVHGPAGVFVAVGKGFLRVMQIDWNAVADIVPVDYVNNMLMAVGWITAMNRSPSPVVYHCNTGSINPINWGKLTCYMVNSYTENPFDEIFRRPGVIKCRPFAMWPLWQFVLHYLPAYLTDCMLGAVGKKRKVVTAYKKLEAMLEQVSFFTQKTWQWSHSNYDRLLSLLSEEDRQKYNFDMNSIQWERYISTFCMGTKKYLLKDDISNLARARRQITRHRIIRYLSSIIVFLAATHVLFLHSQLARKVWFQALNTCMKYLHKLLFYYSAGSRKFPFHIKAQ